MQEHKFKNLVGKNMFFIYQSQLSDDEISGSISGVVKDIVKFDNIHFLEIQEKDNNRVSYLRISAIKVMGERTWEKK
jgi:hypothetical protein